MLLNRRILLLAALTASLLPAQTFQGQISEEGVFQIIAYLRSLKTERTRVAP